MKYLILLLALTVSLQAQPPTLANSADIAAAKDLANATGTLDAARIADGALPIAKTSGLQTALDGKGAKKTVADTQFLTLPITDGFQSCTHPSELRVPGGWNGYEYWMAATPFPTDVRENPHLWASHDGSTWVVPDGATNPVMSGTNIAGRTYTAWSDPQIIILHTAIGGFDAGTMVMFGRPIYGSGNEGIVYKTSTNGVTWTDYVEIANNAIGYKYISPAIVQEANGTLTMWCVDGGTGTVRKYVSSNLTTWTSYASSTLCVFGNSLASDVWHLDVKLRDGKYHALIVRLSNYYLSYCVSSDGITWVGQDGPQSIIPIQTAALTDSAAAYDKRGFYKSCFIPSPDGPDRWDMKIVMVGSQLWNNSASAGTTQFNTIHRIQSRKGVRLGKARLNVQKSGGGTTSVPTSTYTKMTFPSLFATDWWDATNSRFTPPPGWYQLTVNSRWSPGETVGSRYQTIYKNGVSLGLIGGENMGAAGQSTASATQILYANGSDYFESYVYQVTGSTCTVMNDAGTNFQAVAID